MSCYVLDLQKSSGLLSVLDAESNLPKASDLTFANKLKQHLNLNTRFKGERGRAFSVRHYAGEVGFCCFEKIYRLFIVGVVIFYLISERNSQSSLSTTI